MIYRAEFEGPALVQLNGLPPAVFDALVERVVALVQEPWDADLLVPGDDPAYLIMEVPALGGRCQM